MSRGEPTVPVTCDRCGTTREYYLTALAGGGYDERGLDRQLAADGWLVFDDEDICPDCAQERDG